MSTTIHHPRAALNLRKNKILVLLATARVIYNAMLANPAAFSLPIPALALVLAQITALDLAQQVVATRAVEAVARRNQARDTLWESLVSLRNYVQTVANAAGDGAVALIKEAGMDVALMPVVTKPILRAKLSSTPGLVQLYANASILLAGSRKAATYRWQYSIDGGHTWVLAVSTPIAKTTLSGLPRMTLCYFRVAITQGGVMEDWSSPAQLAVL